MDYYNDDWIHDCQVNRSTQEYLPVEQSVRGDTLQIMNSLNELEFRNKNLWTKNPNRITKNSGHINHRHMKKRKKEENFAKGKKKTPKKLPVKLMRWRM